MKRVIQCMLIGFLAASGGLSAARAELVARQPDSIFDADGLMADYSEPEPVATNRVFQAGIKQFPLLDVRKPLMAPRPSNVGSTGPMKTHLPGPSRAGLLKADEFARQQDWPRALAEIQQALEMDPANPQLITKAAVYAALARKFTLADEYFQRVLIVYPDSVVFLTGRAGVLIRLLKLKEANALVERALAIDPAFLAARFDKLCLQIALGETDLLDEGWELLNTDNVVDVANWLDADKQDYMNALKAEGYSRLCDIVLGPGTAPRVTEIVSLLRSARMASAGGQWAVVASELSKVQKAGVRALGIGVDIGRALFQKGDPNAALAHFKALADRYPKVGSVLYDYSFVLISMSMYEEAGAVLERVCQLDPKDGQAAFALACTYAARGQMDKAWPILTRLAASNPADMPSWMTGDKPYQVAIRKDPRYPALMKLLEPAPKEDSTGE